MVKFMKYPAVLAFLFLSACCTLPHPPLPHDPTNPLKHVAVLPIKNDSNDVDGPEVVRAKMIDALQKHSYVVKDVKETDQILRDQMGISLGGQLNLTTAQKLGEALGVEGVMYGTLMDFDETTTGVLNVKKVRGTFKLVNTQTGQTFWARGLGVRSEMRMSGLAGAAASVAAKAANSRDKEVPWVTIESQSSGSSNVGKSFLIGLGTKLVSKAVGKHLDYESTELARMVTDNLPWGPGTGNEPASVPQTAPKINMPEVRAPEPPSFGHMEFGKKDFSAVMIYTMASKGNNQTQVMEAAIAKLGEKFRSDMDMNKMVQGKQGMPPDLSRMIVISRGDKQAGYTLYPNKKKYISHEVKDNGGAGEPPKIEKTKLGTETIDGHPCDKYRVRVVSKDGKVFEGLMWNARDLDGMTIKTETENNDYKTTMEMKQVVLKKPAASLFEIPADYTEAKSFVELVMPDKGGQK